VDCSIQLNQQVSTCIGYPAHCASSTPQSHVCCTHCWSQVADIVAKQRRIERQDKPTVEGVSFEHSAAGLF